MLIEKPPLDDALLEHFGVRGMHWGERKQRTAAEQTKHDKRMKTVKIAGAILGAAVVAGGAYYLHQQYGVSMKQVGSSGKTVSSGKKFAEAVTKEPAGIVHATRGKNKGFRFLQHGGLNDPLHEYEKGMASSEGRETFRKYDGKVAARFLDPQGRKDFAGRQIPHEVIVPAHLAHDVNNLDDVKSKIWPMIKDDYQKFYENSIEGR